MSQTNGQERQRHQERHTHLRTWTRTIPKETDRTNITPGTIKTIGPATSQTLAKSTGTFVTASSRASSPALSRTSSSLSSAPSITTSDYRQRNGEQVLITNTTNSVIERTSFLGSVWNLFRDVKDLASKEIDRLLEHFPYKNNTQTITTINQSDLQERLLSVKRRQRVATTSLSTASLPRKSFLGHGPSQKRRTRISQESQAGFSRRLFDQDLRTQVNDVSTRRKPGALSSIIPEIPTESRPTLPTFSRSSSVVSDTRSRQSNTRLPLATPRTTPTPPLLKSDSSLSVTFYRSSQDTEADWSSAVSHLDEIESLSSVSRSSAKSREPSATPPITSMAEAMSISSHIQTSLRPQREKQSLRPSTQGLSNRYPSKQSHRNPLSYSDSTLITSTPTHHQGQHNSNDNSASKIDIYVQSSGQNGTQLAKEECSNIMESSNHSSNDDIDNPFIVSSNQPSLKQETQISSPSTIDSATLSDLVQQVTTMREQLAALLAEKESQRFYSTVTSISPGGMPPPPPPPPPLLLETPSSKLRTPPVNEATRSMQRVLNELSTSKIHLRKTGSPFLSRISAAVDSSPNSKFSRVIFKSRMDKLPDKFSENSNIGSIAPLSLVSHLRGSNNGTNSIDPASRISDADVPETPTKRKSRPIYQEPEEEKVVLDWPSPRTVKRADSRLDIAAKEISHTKYNKKLSVQAIGNNGVLKIKKIERGTGNPGKLMNSGLTEAKSSQVLESKRKFNYHSYHNTETEVKETVSKSEKNSEVDIQESLVGRDEAISDNVFGRERSGPRLENSNKRPKRPTRPQSAILSRSMTDPTTINSSSSLFTTIPMTTDADKERERQWFLESDIDGWKVAQ